MLITADKVVLQGRACRGIGIEVDAQGRFGRIGPLEELGRVDVNLHHSVVLPGLINAHTQSIARPLRGHGLAPPRRLYWPRLLQQLGRRLDPSLLRVVARQAYLEMLSCGITCAGEFYYMHGASKSSPHAFAEALCDAARDVGIRLSLLYAIYLRPDAPRGASEAPGPFCLRSLDEACDLFDSLVDSIIDSRDARISWGVAAHGLSTVPGDALVGLKVRLSHMPLHIRAATHPEEVQACLERYGSSPIEWLCNAQIVDACTTLVHATHLRGDEAQLLARSGALVCACPSTEADMGSQEASAIVLQANHVPMCLGTGIQAQASLLHEARALALQARQVSGRRQALYQDATDATSATTLLTMATAHGATALGVDAGALQRGRWADFITFDLRHPSLAGANDDTLLSALLFAADNGALRDVFVGGKRVIHAGQHPYGARIGSDFADVSAGLFAAE